jgi:hypothetical protein
MVDLSMVEVQFCEKHDLPRIEAIDGIRLGWSDEDENGSRSIRRNGQFDSGLIGEDGQ